MLTNEQIEARKTGIGGSDAAAICGLSKYRTPLDVYLEKKDLKEPDHKEFFRIRSALEPVVADLYCERTGRNVALQSNMLRHKTHQFMIANIDRCIVGENAILECKTADPRTIKNFGEQGTDEIPDDYLLQCAHYAIVCDVERVDIAVLIGINELRIYEYERNSDLEKRLIQIESDFWNLNFLKDVPPEPKSYQEVSALYPLNDDTKTLIADDDVMIDIETLKQIKDQIKTLEMQKEISQMRISNFMRDASILFDSAGKKLASWKMQTANRFDTAAFKAEHPDLYKQFAKQSSSRVFRI